MADGAATIDSLFDLLETDKIVEGFLPIHIGHLITNSLIEFDLYQKVQENFVLYRNRNLPFTEESRKKLLAFGVKLLYIRSEEKDQYSDYIENNIAEILSEESIPPKTKAKIFYGTAKRIVSDVYEGKLTVDKLDRAHSLANNTMDYLLSGKKTFYNLANSLSFDYSLYTHSINVFVFSISLGTTLDIWEDEKLEQLGIAALMHDIGKTRISRDILDKKGPLNEIEWAEVRKHPIYSAEILKAQGSISEEIQRAVLEHHEREDGSGYPYGRSFHEIGEFGRIISIAEVYDSLTTNRSYAQANATFDALKIMKSQMHGFFDEEFLNKFIGLFRL